MDWNSEAIRNRINSYAPYLGAGIEVTHVARDWTEIWVQMSLHDGNANLVGTHFGGSLYAMVDPHLMILLRQRLGPDYVVWDKSARIDFVRPGLGTVRSTVRLTDAEVAAVRAATEDGNSHLPEWTLEILDEKNELVATVVKTLYVRRRRPDS
jgi:acyl-coenzyme A thioesterase PaaI-like protein